MQKIKNNVFLKHSLTQVPRLLSLLNRSSRSRTYGCFDRNYWLLHTADTPNTRMQEAVYTLALLYAHNFPDNVYYKDAQVLEWINAILSYAASVQHSDGSFDESYYNERSFVCTSFVLLALCQTTLVLNLQVDEKLRLCLNRAAGYVRKEFEDVAFNQTAGNIYALLLASKILNDQDLRSTALVKLSRFLGAQDAEGWWPEYGGPDVGYLSLSIDYLSGIFKETADGRIKEAIKRAVYFLSHFLHPDFSAGGEYMSRNTEYVVPSGHNNLTEFGAVALEKNMAVWPGSMSDDYLHLLSHWIRAGLNSDNA